MKQTANSFSSRIQKTATCWLWTGTKNHAGYGRFMVDGRRVGAHRHSYILAKGPIPAGLQIDHLCRVRACVNPDHLEAITQEENILRGFGISVVNAKKTHCPQGHPLSGTNLLLGKHRRCRTCQTQRLRMRYLRDLAARAQESKI